MADTDLEDQINTELKTEEESELKTLAKEAIKINRQSQALRDKWIERRTTEKKELLDLEKQTFEALKNHDKKALKGIVKLINNVGQTDSLDGYHSKYGKMKRHERPIDDLDDERY